VLFVGYDAMAACGADFTVVVTELGDVFAWDAGVFGQLGLNTHEHQLLP
jgi:alpha-tubulin suppressor-like RCC1 family protein